MLETVKQKIDNFPDTPFYEYFTDYVIDIHNKMIDREIEYMRNHNQLNPTTLNKLIEEEIERLNQL